jgi:hypothetical protein
MAPVDLVNSEILSVLCSHPSQSPTILRVSFLQWDPVRSMLSPMQLPRSYDKQNKEAI